MYKSGKSMITGAIDNKIYITGIEYYLKMARWKITTPDHYCLWIIFFYLFGKRDGLFCLGAGHYSKTEVFKTACIEIIFNFLIRIFFPVAINNNPGKSAVYRCRNIHDRIGNTML